MRRTAFLLLTLALLTVPVCAVQLPGELLDALPEEAAALAEGEGITEEGVQLLVQSFFDALRASLDRSHLLRFCAGKRHGAELYRFLCALLHLSQLAGLYSAVYDADGLFGLHGRQPADPQAF